MRCLAFLDTLSLVRGSLLVDTAGEVLARSGTLAAGPSPHASVLGFSQELTEIGGLAGLGLLQSALVKSADFSRMLALNKQLRAWLELQPTCSIPNLERELRDNEWVTKDATEVKPPAPPPAANVRLPPRAAVPAAPLAPRKVPAPSAVATRPRSATPPLATPLQSPARPEPPPAPAVSAVPAAPAVSTAPNRARNSGAGPISAPFKGSLRRGALADILEFLRVGQRSGTLTCMCDGAKGSIELCAGKITAAETSGVPSLAEALVSDGVLSPNQLEQVRPSLPIGATGQVLISVLLAENAFDRDALREALQGHVIHVVRRLMSWDSGEFRFMPVAVDAPVPVAGIALDPQGILLEIFKQLDDAKRS